MGEVADDAVNAGIDLGESHVITPLDSAKFEIRKAYRERMILDYFPSWEELPKSEQGKLVIPRQRIPPLAKTDIVTRLLIEFAITGSPLLKEAAEAITELRDLTKEAAEAITELRELTAIEIKPPGSSGVVEIPCVRIARRQERRLPEGLRKGIHAYGRGGLRDWSEFDDVPLVREAVAWLANNPEVAS